MCQWIFNLKLCGCAIKDENDFLSRAEENDDSEKLRVLMDQKAYLEEINRNLRWGYVDNFTLFASKHK